MSRRHIRWIIILAVLGFMLVRNASNRSDEELASSDSPISTLEVQERMAEGARVIADAYRTQTSGVVLEAGGRVQRSLPDDAEGSRHQRFIVRLVDDATVLISHNIDLADRVPLSEGDPVTFRGQYEWNEQGGVVHWTHHDPNGRREGGWIEHRGTIYR